MDDGERAAYMLRLTMQEVLRHHDSIVIYQIASQVLFPMTSCAPVDASRVDKRKHGAIDCDHDDTHPAPKTHAATCLSERVEIRDQSKDKTGEHSDINKSKTELANPTGQSVDRKKCRRSGPTVVIADPKPPASTAQPKAKRSQPSAAEPLATSPHQSPAVITIAHAIG